MPESEELEGKLVSVTLSGFQSYWRPETVEFDSGLTLLAGKNDVGKSALLRALSVFAGAPIEGGRQDFQITLSWRLPLRALLEANPGFGAAGHPEWLLDHGDQLTLSASFHLVGAPQAPRDTIQSSSLACTRFELVEVGAVAEVGQGDSAGKLIWREGPFAGTGHFLTGFVQLVITASAAVTYVGPRRTQLGQRGTVGARVLMSHSENLTEAVFYMQLNEPATRFRTLREFMVRAFPQLEEITARTSDGQQLIELHVIYKGAVHRLIPLTSCGTGVEQMLALGTAILTKSASSVFLIDEPHAYLHPEAERTLDAFLQAHPEHQYVIATHSGVLLGTKRLSQTRLVRMQDGASRLVQPDQAFTVLEELGLTAADLWLSGRVLWVEGASEVRIISLVGAATHDPDVMSIKLQEMPSLSRFAASGVKTAQRTFSFLETVVAAVAPVPVQMLFLFDSNEKTDQVKAGIEKASGGRARFLPVRELENLLLRAGSIYEVIQRRCRDLEQEPPTVDDVQASLDELLRQTDDRKLYPGGLHDGESPDEEVVGSEVLERLYREFLKAEYRKTEDGPELAARILQDEPSRLDALQAVLLDLAAGSGP